MALIKYYRPEFNFDTFNRAWDQLFEANFPLKEDKQFFKPQVDIVETDKDFTLELVVPGINKEDIKIELNEDQLIISGERKTLESDVSVTYHKIQSNYGKFSQSFYLPDTVDKESIKAKQENGILNIVIGKKEKKENKSVIEVK